MSLPNHLEYWGMMWLRFEKGCRFVLNERSPREVWCGRPDILGITDARYTIEIEVKRTLADFRANARKCHVQHREMYLAKAPKQFYFLVPPELAEKVKPEVPAWAGLLTTPPEGKGGYLRVVQKCPQNEASKRLTVKECVALVRSQSNQMLALQSTILGLLSQLEYRSDPYGVEYQI